MLIWSFTAFLFVAFIAWLCYLYPLGADEYSLYPRHALDIIQGFFLACLTNSPRIGIIPARIVLFISDYAFAVINPLIQLALALLSFYAVFLRLPNFKTLKDYPVFLLILILNTFAVAQPDNNIFWIGGASNYGWPLLLFLPFVIIIRIYLRDGKDFPPSLNKTPTPLFLAAFMLGMAGETLGPASLILIILTSLYLKLNGKNIPRFLKISAAGVGAGLVVFFSSPGLYFRVNMEQYEYFRHLPLTAKIITHASFLLKACAANFFLFPITALILLFHYLRNKSLDKILFPAALLLLALAMACALALAPIVNLRPFYPATYIIIIAFVYSLTLLKIPLRFIMYPFLIFAVIITPLFAAPFFALNKQQEIRKYILRQAEDKGQKEVFLLHFIVPKGPYDNLSVYFYDAPVTLRNKYLFATQPADRPIQGQKHIKQF